MHYQVQTATQTALPKGSDKNSTIWSAPGIALGLHIVFLLLPLSIRQPGDSNPSKPVEVQLATTEAMPLLPHLTSTLLASQFLPAEAAPDPFFSIQPDPDFTQPDKVFHFPARQDMLAMLDKPLPDLPFEYTPGLIYFAYDPGIKGDLQRFLDAITPEFGWTTRYGTEVKCVWLLVIAACGWK